MEIKTKFNPGEKAYTDKGKRFFVSNLHIKVMYFPNDSPITHIICEDQEGNKKHESQLFKTPQEAKEAVTWGN